MKWVRNDYFFGKLVTLVVMIPLVIVWASIDWPSEMVQIVGLVAIGVCSVIIAGWITPRLLAKWGRGPSR